MTNTQYLAAKENFLFAHIAEIYAFATKTAKNYFFGLDLTQIRYN